MKRKICPFCFSGSNLISEIIRLMPERVLSGLTVQERRTLLSTAFDDSQFAHSLLSLLEIFPKQIKRGREQFLG